MPDADQDTDVDADAPSTPILGVVHPPEPEDEGVKEDPTDPLRFKRAVDEATRKAFADINDELTHLREQRREDDREGLAEIARKRDEVKTRRADTNKRIKALVDQQETLARLVRVLDKP